MIMRALLIRAAGRGRCARFAPRAAAAAAVVALSLPAAAGEPAAAASAGADSRVLRATGMTFVSSSGDTSELVLRSRFATFYPDRDLAHLEQVAVTATDETAGDSFELTCDRADLNVETNDFRAEGDVRGTTSQGQRYAAPWVEYDHEAGLLHTDAPVSMVDGMGRFRGDGFRYRVADRTFRLMGNVSVEQMP
jgi:LPS export ABC transporter protein LptC